MKPFFSKHFTVNENIPLPEQNKTALFMIKGELLINK